MKGIMIGYIFLAFIVGGIVGWFGYAILTCGARVDKVQEKHYKKEIQKRRDG